MSGVEVHLEVIVYVVYLCMFTSVHGLDVVMVMVILLLVVVEANSSNTVAIW